MDNEYVIEMKETSLTSSKDLIIHSNRIFVNSKQGIICSFRYENVTIINNIVEHNIEGTGLPWLTNSSLIKNNTVKIQ